MDRSRRRALYVLDPDAFTLVYGPEQQAAISELVDVIAPPCSSAGMTEHSMALATAEILLSGWGAPFMDAAFLRRAPALRAVFYGAGAVRGFVTPELFRAGIVISSANKANAVPVSEYALAVILFSLKHGWRVIRGPEPQSFEPPGAYHSTVGVIGLGAIGRLVCERLRPFDLQTVAHDPFATGDLNEVELVALDELFARSHVVSLHAPLHDGTRGMVTGELIGAMRPGGTIVNSARGALVNHDELADVLARRHDLQAVLDVTDPEPFPASHPLRQLPNVIITPHIAGSIGPECRRLGDSVVAELRRYLRGEPLRHKVDHGTLDIAAQP